MASRISPLIEASGIDEMSKPLLKVAGLRIYFHTVDGIVKAVRDMSFDVFDGRVLGVVGESGSGKTVTGRYGSAGPALCPIYRKQERTIMWPATTQYRNPAKNHQTELIN